MAEREKQYTIDILASMAERTIKRLWIIIILLVVLLFGTNAAWIVYESQWEVVETEVQQEVETGIGDAFVSGTGDVIYGTSETDSEDAAENP